jgi:tape measure domain-containing protein
LVLDRGQFDSGIKTTQQQLEQTEKQGNKTTQSMKGLGDAMSAIKTAVFAGGFAAVAKGILDVGVANEKITISFTTMLGSATKAKVLLGELSQFAGTTPFELPQVQQAARQLLAFGITAKDIQPTLRNLGDIAAGVGIPIEQLAQIYGKVAVQGKVTGDILQQLGENGVPVVAALAKQFNTTSAAIYEMASKSKISFSDFRSALQGLTTSGGQFQGLMENLSKSVGGKLSNLSDGFTRLGVSIFKGFSPELSKGIDVVSGALDGLNKEGDQTAATVKTLVEAVTALLIARTVGPAIEGLAAAITAERIAALGATTTTEALSGAMALMGGPTGTAVLAAIGLSAVIANMRRVGDEAADAKNKIASLNSELSQQGALDRQKALQSNSLALSNAQASLAGYRSQLAASKGTPYAAVAQQNIRETEAAIETYQNNLKNIAQQEADAAAKYGGPEQYRGGGGKGTSASVANVQSLNYYQKINNELAAVKDKIEKGNYKTKAEYIALLAKEKQLQTELSDPAGVRAGKSAASEARKAETAAARAKAAADKEALFRLDLGNRRRETTGVDTEDPYNIQLQKDAEQGLKQIATLDAITKALDEIAAKKAKILDGLQAKTLQDKAGILRGSGDIFGANALDKQAAILQANAAYQARLLEIKSTAGQTADEFHRANEEAALFNQLSLKNIDSQFKTLGQTITDNFKGTFESSIQSLIEGKSTIEGLFQSLISNLIGQFAQLAANNFTKALFGGSGDIFSSLFGGIFGGAAPAAASYSFPAGTLGFSSGGTVTSDGISGQLRRGRNPISAALQREGPNSVLAALTPGEQVLNLQEAQRYRAMYPQGIPNFAGGGAVGNVASGGASGGTSITINVPVDNRGSSGQIDAKALENRVRATVVEEITRQTKNGGLIAGRR